jgi:hypothetical protein
LVPTARRKDTDWRGRKYAGLGSPCFFGAWRPFSTDSPAFLEAKVSLPPVNRMSNDDVIKHLDLENPGSFVESPSQAKIGFARAWISGYAVCGITGYTASSFMPHVSRIHL